MKLLNNHIRFSATDVANHLGCSHLTHLNRRSVKGELSPPVWNDPYLEVLQQRGFEHEAAYLDHLNQKYGYDIERIPEELEEQPAIDRTIELMRSSVPVIVQASLASEQWHGRADVLLKCNTPSELGNWAYEIVDTKLARETRADTILQLCVYAELIAGIQGAMPARLGVVTPLSFDPEWYRTDDYAAYFRYVKQQLLGSEEQQPSTYPDPVPHCSRCRWQPDCRDTWRADDHLSLVAGISRGQRKELVEREVPTMAALANLPLPIPFKPNRGAAESFERAREQARVQVAGREANGPVHELKTVEPERGLCRLPEPSNGDVFFDIEGDINVGQHGLEYLFGIAYWNGTDELDYTAQWALNAENEKKALDWFVDFIETRRKTFPDLHVYHFGHYEPSAIKRLMSRHATCEDQIDNWLRSHLFVDLHRIVREALIASVERYSIKELERGKFYEFTRVTNLEDARVALFQMERALELRLPIDDPEISKAVESYNRDDCLSTTALQAWLESLRSAEITAGREVPRPDLTSTDVQEEFNERRERILAKIRALTEDVPAEEEERSAEEHARWLLAHCLDFHWRENKTALWEKYRLMEMDPADYIDEREALWGLEFVEHVGGTVRRPIHRYRYAPQDCVMREKTLHAPDGTNVGETENIDFEHRLIDIKRNGKTKDWHPGAVFGYKFIGKPEFEARLEELADWVIENGMHAAGPYRAARDLLLREPPRLADGGLFSAPKEPDTMVEDAKPIVSRLERTVLPIQGPPGSGKTYLGARLITHLVGEGKKVGVAANSHAVVRNLLLEVMRAVAEQGMSISVYAKPDDPEGLEGSGIECVTGNPEARDAIDDVADVMGGTTFLWARPEMTDAVDVLIVDEASQLSLADTLAISQGTKSLVLIGDPRQLEQPQQASHPPGIEASPLDHLLRGAETISDKRGIFLPQTRRLAPGICAFTSEVFYEGRLSPLPGLENQELKNCGPFSGSGLHLMPVEHSGNQSISREEVGAVRSIVDRLLANGTWVNADEEEVPLSSGDILIVAPYNAQVTALLEALPGMAIGTVDKFQGKEAPIVIYSMATSSADEAPRGMDFLYSGNRLNVASSRARCTVIVVANPDLFEVDCRTPAQAKLANAYCRYLEMATAHNETEA